MPLPSFLSPKGLLFLRVSHKKLDQMVPLTVSAWGKTAPMQAVIEAGPAAGKGTKLGHPHWSTRWSASVGNLRALQRHILQGSSAFEHQTPAKSSGKFKAPPGCFFFFFFLTLPIASGTLEQWLLPSRPKEGGGVRASCRVGLRFWIFI